MAHVESVRQLLTKKQEYEVRVFYFETLDKPEQNVVGRVLGLPTGRGDGYVGICNPLVKLAFLLDWNNKRTDGLTLNQNALKSLN